MNNGVILTIAVLSVGVMLLLRDAPKAAGNYTFASEPRRRICPPKPYYARSEREPETDGRTRTAFRRSRLMNESGHKVIALLVCVLCAAGAIASWDYAAPYGGYWGYNTLALAVMSAVFLIMALMDGETGGRRSGDVNVNIDNRGRDQPWDQQQQPQIIVMPSPHAVAGVGEMSSVACCGIPDRTG